LRKKLQCATQDVTTFKKRREEKGEKNSHPLAFVASGITCPSGGLFASVFRFKLAGSGDPSAVSKFLLLSAMFFIFPFSFFGFAYSRLPFVSMDALVEEGKKGVWNAETE
jgi:hypothetical protein